MKNRTYVEDHILDGKDFSVHHFKHNSFSDIKAHAHSFYEIYMLISPSIKTTVSERSFAMKKGDVLIVPPFAEHSSNLLEQGRYERIVAWVKASYITNLFNTNIFSLSSPFYISLSEEDYGDYCHSLIKLSEEIRRSDFASDLMIHSILNEFLVFLARKIFISNTALTRNPLIDDIKSYIDKNITLPLTVNDIAKSFFISKYFLCRKFKKCTGTTVYHYIITKRIQSAKAYINEGYSFSEASSLSGFSDYSNFFKLFLSEVGMTPSEFAETCNPQNQNEGP